MSAISFGGLASGIDTNSIITQLVKLERTPIDTLSQRQTTNTSRKAKWTSLRSKLEDLRTASAALNTASKASPVAVTSSNSSVLTATSSSGGSAGRYDIRVDRLAQASRTYSDAYTSNSQAGLFGTGTLSIQVGTGTAIDVAVDGTDSLDSVAAKINASGAAVQASVLFDGGTYRLQIAGNQTGAANAVTLTESGTSLGVASPANVRQQAVDAQVTIDGFAVTRPTNSLSDVIAGVNLELKDVSPTGTTQRVDVTRDTGALTDKVKKFVDAYNIVNNFINAEATYSGVTKGAESLVGDSTVRSLQTRLRSQITSPVGGITGRYSSLAAIGVSLQRDGSLALDSAKLSAAISADPAAVSQVFAKPDTGAMVALDKLVNQYTSTSDGLIGKRVSAIDDANRNITKQMSDLEDRVTKFEDRLRAQFTAMEQTMSRIQNQGSQITSIMNSLSGASSSKS